MHILDNFTPDGTWTLFLDRDGVINRNRENDYVKRWSEFEFIPGSLEAIAYFSEIFGRICVITNQQGIGKGIMSHEDLAVIHAKMMAEIEHSGGRIDRIYYCPELAEHNPKCRKPSTGMGEQAAKDFPEIEFSKTIMVGDSLKDMEFASNLGLYGFFVNGIINKFEPNLTYPEITKLSDLASYMRQIVDGI